MPNQKQRQKGVRAKLNPMKKKFEGRNVLLVDDSIVRGTTSKEIVLMAREAGAKKVFFSSCAPPITNAHIYGIDLASSSELIAHHRSPQDIATMISADAVIFQTLPDLISACASVSVQTTSADRKIPQNFEVGVFCGKYVTPVADGYFEHLERIRGETRKQKVVAKAREAVLQGCASDKDVQLATHDADIDRNGNVVPLVNGTAEQEARGSPQRKGSRGLASFPRINGEGPTFDEEQRERGGGDGQVRVRERAATQDISLHNLNDFNE
ncbi:hypothetical protein LTS18_003574 [Coniosporium uncinatum]|uniref:Uncharacterized protein n=1 Tax=Coniosporium uncinatum TaxID=93489 RepID=A0ACC3DTQ2_9PEZI|nr:hypothetical protein LTS18_003574 [Coniosporium uncinatum]